MEIRELIGETTEYKFSDFSFSKLRERYKMWTGNSLEDKEFLSYGLVDKDSMLTNAGVLLADNSPIRWSRLFCTRWNGFDKSGGTVDALDDAEYSGSLLSLLENGMAFIKRNVKTMWKKTADSRIEIPEYVERSYLEALVNALVHRDYLIHGSEVHIDLFHDRMVIYSPGGMSDGTLIQDRIIDSVPSTRRNPILADIFQRVGLMERKGSGLTKIIKGYENAFNYRKGKEPQFLSSRVEFTVTLKNLNASSEASALDSTKTKEKTKGKTSTAEEIIRLLKQDSQITTAEMAETLNLSKSGVEYQLRKLKEKQILVRVGPAKGGYWKVK